MSALKYVRYSKFFYILGGHLLSNIENICNIKILDIFEILELHLLSSIFDMKFVKAQFCTSAALKHDFVAIYLIKCEKA